MNRCKGCGAVLQNKNPLGEGYARDLNNSYCERCFRITHYNDYILNSNDNNYYLKKISGIKKTGDLVVLTVDFLNLFDIDSLNIKNPVILTFTKKDLLPRCVNINKFLNSINFNLNIVSKLFVSSKNNYNLDLLYENILKYKKSNNVYVIGLTNAGKSSLINKILKNYSNNISDITISNLPSTTLDFLEKKVNDNLCLIDTPGLLDSGSIIMESSKEDLKKIIPKKQINPIIFQIKTDQSIIIENYARIDVLKDNNITLYMSNNLNIDRFYKDNEKLKDLSLYKVNIDSNNDLVIKGLGFIKFKNKCHINLYLKKNVKYYVRKSII